MEKWIAMMTPEGDDISEETKTKIEAIVRGTKNGQVIDASENGAYEAEQKALLRIMEDPENSLQERLIIFNVQPLIDQFIRWRKCLPRNHLRVAVKCNPDKILLKVLIALGAGFDCASPQEMIDVMEAGCLPSDIVYSNPCKQDFALKYMASSGIKLTVFDNDDELVKIAKFVPWAELLIRIRCDDVGSRCPMSCKFGSGPEDWERLLTTAKSLQLKLRGVHFHVGSGCGVRNAFNKPIMQARQIFDLAEKLGMEPLHIVNTGGGYPGLYDPKDQPLEDVTFEDMAFCIREALDKNFPIEEFGHVTVMSEPGRYFAAGTQTIATAITSRHVPAPLRPKFGMKVLGAKLSNLDCDDQVVIYTIAESVYGYFNVILFDHAQIWPHVLKSKKGYETIATENNRELFKTDLYGMSCDKWDKIAESVKLPALDVGDWVFFKNQGAYTSAAITSYGGDILKNPVKVYLRIVPKKKS